MVVMGWRLDLMILEVFSNFNESMTLAIKTSVALENLCANLSDNERLLGSRQVC